jgi:hypothetical protein
MKKYAYIKDGVVQNLLAFEDGSSIELLQQVADEYSYDEFVECTEYNINVGFLYVGSEFYREEGKKALLLDEFNPDLITVRDATPEELAAHQAEFPEQYGERPEN